uniref:Galectin n=1 Tax=Neogobius melanostomus TaxID=47308 RepID=A0A8C6SDX0_9GOBI
LACVNSSHIGDASVLGDHPRGLAVGEMLLIQGTVPSNADRFQVDLMCGSSAKPRADVAFHFNPRVKKGCVVCNSLLKESWGREEIHKLMPFRPGAAFELIILVQSDIYKVAVNGAHLVEYKHRLELQRVDTLMIQGKDCLTRQVCPTIRTVPHVRSVPQIRTVLVWQIMTFKHELTLSSIALHLNPRLKTKDFVRNSFLSACWGPEETESNTSPSPRTRLWFLMIVLCEASQFRVAVNGTHQFDYKHRVQDLSRVTLLELSGDLRLEEVQLL